MKNQLNKMNWRNIKVAVIGIAAFVVFSIGVNLLVDWTTPTTQEVNQYTGEKVDIPTGKSWLEPLVNLVAIGNMALTLAGALFVSYYGWVLFAKNTVGKYIKSDEFDEGWRLTTKQNKTLITLVAFVAVTCALILGTKANTLPISKEGYNLILKYEVSSKRYYENKLQYLTVPAPRTTASGATGGFGYDCGHNSKAQIASDWKGILSDREVGVMQSLSGLKGMSAYYAVQRVGKSVRIPWSAAEKVFQNKTLPRFSKLTAKAFEIDCDRLHPHCNGALVSTVFNRGSSMKNTYKRREMRWIKYNISVGREDRVPSDFMVMRHQWSHTKLRGLWKRYEATSQLFALGLLARVE